jgi:hypothetical protein
MWDSGTVTVGGSATPWSLPFGGSADLVAATPFTWRVMVQAASAPIGGADAPWSAWSDNATLVPGPAPGAAWALADVAPVWARNTSAELVLLRGSLRVPPGRSVAAAFAFATAQPQRSVGDEENGKLLGAYKLFVGGALVGLGPGRPGRCGPVCPVSHSPGNCSCEPEHVYDVLDVTLALAAAAAAGGGEAVLALQCFHAAAGPDSARVQLQVTATLDDGSIIMAGTVPGDGAFSAMDATSWMQPSCCTESAWFFGPQENWAMAREPVGWRLPGFAPAPADGWAPPVSAGAFFAPLVPKPTLPLVVASGLPAVAVRSPAAGVTVFDFGRELQGGLTVVLGANTPAGLQLALQFGEELKADGTVLFTMRTGNNYSGVATTRAGAQVIETHEYLEWRYAQVVELGAARPAPCATSALGDYSTPLTLACAGEGASISAFSFGSWGTPSGSCAADGGNNFAVNASCAFAGTLGVLESLCIGQAACTFTPSDTLFGKADPCHLVDKRLAAAWTCSLPPPPPPPPLDLSGVTAWQVSYPASFAGDAADACDGGAAASGAAGGSYSGAGQFESSSADLNAVFGLCEYTVRATNLDLVTDSNTRQRSPVCAEAMLATNVNQGVASFEAASQDFLTRYVVNGSPGGAGWAEWQALLIGSVHEGWLASGDLSFFIAQRAQLERYLEPELFNASTGLWTCDAAHSWSCQQPEVDWPSGMRDGFVFKPANTVVNAHYVAALVRFADLVEAAGDPARAAAARAASVALAADMRRLLFNASTGAFEDGLGAGHAAIHSSAYALACGVADGDAAVGAALWATLLARLDAEAGIPVGPYPGLFFGTALGRNTSDHGRALVDRFLTNNGTNSWLNQLRQGATTTMESWTVAEKGNLTWSHPWMAFALQLILRWLLGVRALAAGFARVLIQPQPGGLQWARGVVPTARGAVAVSLVQTLDAATQLPTTFVMNVTVPGAVAASACLPLPACGAGAVVRVDGVSVQGALSGDYACVELAAGPHVLACPA